MQDLDVIQRQNSQAHERDIPNQQAKGLYVVAEYHGLHYIGYTTHASEVEANAKACEIGNEVGRRAKVFAPTQLAAAVQRAAEAQGVHQPDHNVYNITQHLAAAVESSVVGLQPSTATQVEGIVAGGAVQFAGAGAESSWSDTSTCDSNGGLTD